MTGGGGGKKRTIATTTTPTKSQRTRSLVPACVLLMAITDDAAKIMYAFVFRSCKWSGT